MKIEIRLKHESEWEGKIYQRYEIRYKNMWGVWVKLKWVYDTDNVHSPYYLDVDPVSFRSFDEAKTFLDENITCKADLIKYNREITLEVLRRERARSEAIAAKKNEEAIKKAGRTKYFITDLK